ncbi:MAG: deoxyribose-phosphate aldolase [Synergistaceae bacterium]|nr:deoxyribose-phosphate aldolase [Synergistaceae bacterium]
MELSSYIDYTNLNPDVHLEEIRKLCSEAIKHKLASVCVNSSFAAEAANFLKDTDVKVCCVVGFPLGACTTETKVFEAKNAAKSGASEIDMVINISWLKDGFFDKVQNDIKSVVVAVRECIVKVIIETCLLDDDEKVKACEIAKEAGAHFVKTSTGFSKAGATVKDVALMRATVGNSMGVKAAGGIRDYDTAVAMIRAGADRLGTSQLILNQK